MPNVQPNLQLDVDDLADMYPDLSDEQLLDLASRMKGEPPPGAEEHPNYLSEIPNLGHTPSPYAPPGQESAPTAGAKPIVDENIVIPKLKNPTVKAPAPISAPAPTVAPPIASPAAVSPEAPDFRKMVLDGIIKKYGLDKFSQEKRAGLVQQTEDASAPPNYAAGFSALGAGLQGHNAVGAGLDMLKYQNRQRQEPLQQFDIGRKHAFENAEFGENAGDRGESQAKAKLEKDPNSEESKIAQSLAVKMGMSPQIAKKLTAAQFKNFSPAYLKIYEVAANNASREKIAKDKPSQTGQQWQYEYGIYGKRMQEANKVFDSLEKQGFHRESTRSASRSLAPNKFMGKQLQAQRQAERNFMTAVLRKESGATIRDEEMSEGEKLYFPRGGDNEKVLAQKRQNRKQAELSFQSASGPAWNQIPTVPTLFDDSSKPSPGDIENGYKYIGGDPGNQDSWEPVK